MSKSLGNVLDPFEVIERVRRRRAALLLLPRGLASARTARSRPTGFEARYETELANEYGNLASRTLAMIDRYRDGVVPDAERRRRRSPRDFDGARRRASRELLDRAELTPGARGDLAAVRRLNRYVEEQRAVGARQGRGRRRASSTASSTAWPRACACVTRAAARLHARDRPSGCSPRSARGLARELARVRRRAAAASGRASSRRCSRSSSRASPQRRDRHATRHLDLCEPPDGRAGRRGAREAG